MIAFRLLVATGLLLAALIALPTSHTNADTPKPQPDTFTAFVEDYYTALFTWDPNQATYAGIHDHDAKLPDFSATHYKRRAAELKEFHTRLKTLRTGKLTEVDAIDAETLDHAIRAELLEIESVRD